MELLPKGRSAGESSWSNMPVTSSNSRPPNKENLSTNFLLRTVATCTTSVTTASDTGKEFRDVCIFKVVICFVLIFAISYQPIMHDNQNN